MKLTNRLLIASPAMDDLLFRHSVIYLCEHKKDGAMGIMINRPTDTSVAEVIANINFMMAESRSFPPNSVIFMGGPVALDQGFVLHSRCVPAFERSIEVGNDIWLTYSPDALRTLGLAHEPENYLVTLGCCTWQEQQLEEEIRQNMWLLADASTEIIFKQPYHQRWESAVRSLGVTPEKLMRGGHA